MADRDRISEAARRFWHVGEIQPMPFTAQLNRFRYDMRLHKPEALLYKGVTDCGPDRAVCGPDRKVALTQMPVQVRMGTRERPAAYAMAKPKNNWDGILPSGAYKPFGGLWTSTLDTCHTDGWLRWTLAENWRAPSAETWAWAMEPMPARVLRIETPDDVAGFHDRYGSLVIPNSRFRHMNIDWEAVRETYDAVHLPAPAYYQEHVRFGDHLTFSGWDCESTLWLRWRFWRVYPVRVSDLVEKYRSDPD